MQYTYMCFSEHFEFCKLSKGMKLLSKYNIKHDFFHHREVINYHRYQWIVELIIKIDLRKFFAVATNALF